MKKLITLFLAVAGMVGTASATDYILGCYNGGDWYKGADFSKNADGTYTAIMVIPDNQSSFMFTIFSGESINWSNALYAFSGSGEGNKEAYGSGNESTTLYASGHGVLSFPRSSKARVLKIDYNSETKLCTVTRMIVVASGYNSWSQTTDYLYANEEGSEVYEGEVTLEVDSKGQSNGYKFVLLNNGNVYWGTNKGNGYIGDGYDDNGNWVAYSNATVVVDGVYNLTANLSTWAWTDPELVKAKVSAGTYGKATFSLDKALDFTGITTLKAYRAASVVVGAVTMKPVEGKVPANTGLYLEGGTGYIPVTTDAASIGDNLLLPTTGNNIYDDSKFQYVLSDQGGVSFYKVGSTLSPEAGKAYLQTDVEVGGGNARVALIFSEDTGINGVEQLQQTDNRYYNLSGQRVAQPTKGLYIMNGKKVLVNK